MKKQESGTNNKDKRRKKRLSLISIIWIIFAILLIFTIVWFLYGIHKKNIENETTSIDSSIPIPEGFYFVGGTKNTGFVISDNKSDYKKGTSHESLTKLKGNQFVWVPVETPVCADMSEALEIKNSGKYPMAVKTSNGYSGLFYFFDVTTTECYLTQDQTFYKEPAIVNGETLDKLEEYQDKYNKMIKSVEKYKGFYVSRFEVGNLTAALNNNEKINSKYNQSDISKVSWNDIYNLIPKMYERDDITTEMIWGSQWDQIATWYFTSEEYKDSVFSSMNFGNFSGIKHSTGENAKFSLKNIYDIFGNVAEFTQENYPYLFRISKGGSYNENSHMTTIQKYYKMQKTAEQDIGSRITMYINN